MFFAFSINKLFLLFVNSFIEKDEENQRIDRIRWW